MASERISATPSADCRRPVRRVRWADDYEMRQRIEALPGVRGVAAGELAIDTPGVWPVQFREYDGDPPRAETVEALVDYVSPEYLDVLGIPLLRGEGLPPWFVDDAERYWLSTDCALRDRAVCRVLVNKTLAARVWPGEDPIGKELGIYGCCWTVGGVVADVSTRGVDAPSLPSSVEQAMRIYVPYSEFNSLLVKAGGDPRALVAPIRDIVTSIDADVAVSFGTLEERVARSFARPRFYSTVSGAFGAVALLLALVGVYGVMAYTVGERRREVGIRMALGVSQTQIRGKGMRPVVVGLVVGALAALASAQVLASLLYGLSPLDPWMIRRHGRDDGGGGGRSLLRAGQPGHSAEPRARPGEGVTENPKQPALDVRRQLCFGLA